VSFALSVVSESADTPVSVETLKLHAHIDGNAEDGLLDTYIKAATRMAERKLDRSIITKTMRLSLDSFPPATRHNQQAAIYVPRPPLQSISSIGYVQAVDGTTTTMASSDYQVDIYSEPGRITPRWGDVWPTARDQQNAVTIQYVAGYGQASSVPANLQTYILSVAAYYYRVREPVNIGNITAELPLFDSLLSLEDYGRV
jgi:uncharacterized phiE125 gp8 family phage protein